MDLRRLLGELAEKDVERLRRYRWAWERLQRERVKKLGDYSIELVASLNFSNGFTSLSAGSELFVA